MGIDLSIIIVNWNVRDLLRECLRSVLAPMARSAEEDGYALGPRSVEVLVVDNASADGSAEMVRTEFPGVLLVASDVNLGFAAGNNLGLRRVRGRYVLLLNPDTVVRPGALAAMLGYLDAHPRVGLVGPLLRYGDGTVQSSRRRFPSFGQALMESTILEEWFPRNRWAREYRLEDVPIAGPLQVDWVNGSCMMVRSEAIAQVGLLDERIFMYSEELDWCRRLAAAGWAVVFLPEAEVVHYEGRSSGQVAASRQIYFDSSKVYYFGKHHGACQAEALRLFLLLGHLVHLAEEGLKFAVGHKRDLRRERVTAYWRVLRSGLRLPSRGGVEHG